MGMAMAGTALVGVVGAYLSTRAKASNAKDKAARDARAQARLDAGHPDQIDPKTGRAPGDPPAPTPAPNTPPPTPSVSESTSRAVALGTAAGIKQRKRAAAAGNPLFGRQAGAPAPAASYAAKTLVGS